MRCKRCGSADIVLFKDTHRCSVCDSTNIIGIDLSRNEQKEKSVIKSNSSLAETIGKIFAVLLTTGLFYFVGGCREQATDVGKFFFSDYSSDADMFGYYTTMGMLIIMSALASLTPIVMYYFTIRKWDVAAQNKFGVIYYTITLVIPVLLVVGFEFVVPIRELYLFIVLIMIPFTLLGIGIIAAPIISVLVVLVCHRRQDG